MWWIQVRFSFPALRDFDALKGVEVSNFRENKKKMCQTIAKERDKQVYNIIVQNFPNTSLVLLSTELNTYPVTVHC